MALEVADADAAEAIRNLLYRYAEAMDAGRFDTVAGLFAGADLVGPDGTTVAHGYDGALALYGKGTRLHDGSPRTRHLVANPIVEVDPNGTTAICRSVYVVFQATESLALQPIITGRYHDSFDRNGEGRWCFRRRQFFVDLTGDLSHHLAYRLAN